MLNEDEGVNIYNELRRAKKSSKKPISSSEPHQETLTYVRGFIIHHFWFSTLGLFTREQLLA